MKKQILLLSTYLFLTIYSYSQKKDSQIEINSFIISENYPGFSYHYKGRPSTDYLSIKGISHGMNVGYNFSLEKSLLLKIGFGYFNRSFNKIKNTNSVFGKTVDSRPINYLSPLLISYSSNKYHYNNISINTGIEKQFYLKNNFEASTSFNLNGYYNISQYYHLSSNPYDNNLNFKKKDKTFSGFSSNISVGIYKKINHLLIGPALIVPIYETWRKDQIFLEENYDGGKSKWLNGIGIGISIKNSLNKH